MRLISIDGKTIQGTIPSHKECGVRLLTDYSVKEGIALAQNSSYKLWISGFLYQTIPPHPQSFSLGERARVRGNAELSVNNGYYA